MSPVPNNSPLDNFIKNTLKSPDLDLHPIDWSEVEVLLRHEQKPISIVENKKLMLISGAAAVFILLIFGIFKIVQYYSSLPAETETSGDPTKSTFNIMDSSASVIKTAKIGSSFEGDIDSIPLDTVVAPKKTDAALKPVQKQDKKKKQDTALSTVDTSTEKTNTHHEVPSPVVDTTTPKRAIEETKIENPSESDTVGKKSSTRGKKPKNKKSRSQKESSAETKPDSLKQ